jgi:hypothetical protein
MVVNPRFSVRLSGAFPSWSPRAGAVKDSSGIAKRRAVTLTVASTAPDLVGWGQLRSNVASPTRVAVLPIVRRTTTNLQLPRPEDPCAVSNYSREGSIGMGDAMSASAEGESPSCILAPSIQIDPSWSLILCKC